MEIQSLITLIIWIVVLGLIFWLAWWFVGFVGLPEPFNKVVRVIIGLVAFLIIIYFLLGMLPGMPSLRLR